MSLEARIRRWYRHAERQGLALDSILIHPDDYWRNRDKLRFLPLRVIGFHSSRRKTDRPSCSNPEETVMTHRIRCKMICHSVAHNEHGDQTDPKSIVTFGAVWSKATGTPEDENAIFGKYTPWGEYKANWSREVAEKLEVGKAYYVDFIPAD